LPTTSPRPFCLEIGWHDHHALGVADDDIAGHDQDHIRGEVLSACPPVRSRRLGRQGPGRPDEDTRDGFEHGGWAIPRGDEAMVAKIGERMGGDRAFLFGRRTYEGVLAAWNARGGPFKDALNTTPKYVASSIPATRLDWPNSTLLCGDIPAAVTDLKESSGTNLVITGSGVLIGALMAADLIDEYLLMIHPLVLGTGRRLFAGSTPASLRLVDSSTASTGVLIATYAPARG
jgi:dihydrofolate reductase